MPVELDEKEGAVVGMVVVARGRRDSIFVTVSRGGRDHARIGRVAQLKKAEEAHSGEGRDVARDDGDSGSTSGSLSGMYSGVSAGDDGGAGGGRRESMYGGRMAVEGGRERGHAADVR
jgi:hypothetical protein